MMLNEHREEDPVLIQYYTMMSDTGYRIWVTANTERPVAYERSTNQAAGNELILWIQDFVTVQYLAVRDTDRLVTCENCWIYLMLLFDFYH